MYFEFIITDHAANRISKIRSGALKTWSIFLLPVSGYHYQG